MLEEACLIDKRTYQVFVVDDEVEMLRLLSDFLRARGYSVTCFGSATELFKEMSREKRDPLRKIGVIVSDIHMRPIDGFGLLQSVKKTHPDTAVILMTAYDERQEAARAKKEGAFGYLSKPFPLASLEALLHSALEGQNRFSGKD